MLYYIKNNEVKVYGLPRSGTNFLEFMLVHNLCVDVVLLKHGWKHGKARGPIRGIAITKNPFSWLSSIYKFAIKRKNIFHIKYDISFSDFIQSKYVWDSDISGRGSVKVFQQAKNPISHWNEMNKDWYNHSFLIKYEDLLYRTDDTLEEINRYLLKNGINSYFKKSIYWPDSYINPNCVKYVGKIQKNIFQPQDLDFSNEMIRFVKSELDQDLCNKIGYAHL